MGYRGLIKMIQHDSGFSDAESQNALDLMVACIAERLTDEEALDFASQLPPELKIIALSTEMVDRAERHEDIILEFREKEGISEDHAKKQVLTAWRALKSTISDGEIKDIKSQLPNKMAAMLY